MLVVQRLGGQDGTSSMGCEREIGIVSEVVHVAWNERKIRIV